jgi:cysteine dioxygenase
MTPSIAEDAAGVGSAYKPSTDSFLLLVSDLSRILGPTSGLTSEDVDVQKLHRRMQTYISNEKEWTEYAFSDFSRGYTRNLVDEGNGKSNLVCVNCAWWAM